MYKHIEQLEQDTKGTFQVLTCICAILKESKEQSETRFESQKEDKETYLNFKLFKVRKTTAAIAILSMLVFILTLFCIKQRSSYALLSKKILRQETIIKETQTEVDSLSAIKPKGVKKNQ